MRDATASESPEDWETLEAWFAVTSNINEKDIEIDDIEDFDATIISSFSSSNPFNEPFEFLTV